MTTSKYENEAPVLLIVFNRPETTQKVFDEIKKAKINKLYIAADAPRPNIFADIELCKIVRKIFDQIDWDCEVHKRFSDVNQGCGPGPYNAISWVLSQEDRVIVLEDDCVPAQPFFNYCNELLERYKDDNRIWLISGNNYNEEAVTTQHSYFFSKYGHSWGWATWRRAWQEMDLEMKKFLLYLEQEMIYNSFNRKYEAEAFLKAYKEIFTDKTKMNHIWDFQFGFTIKSNGGLTIVPRKNLVSNIGIDGTHSSSLSKYHNRAVDENYRIESHPDFILCDEKYDQYHFKHHWKPQLDRSLAKKILNKLRKIFLN